MRFHTEAKPRDCCFSGSALFYMHCKEIEFKADKGKTEKLGDFTIRQKWFVCRTLGMFTLIISVNLH